MPNLSRKVLKKLKSDPSTSVKKGEISFENQKKYDRAVKWCRQFIGVKFTEEDVMKKYKELGGLLFVDGKPDNAMGVPFEDEE